MSSFLESYKRQPKIYIDLPSPNYYPDGVLADGQAVSLPVFGMTAADEILLKTPDALFNGDATKQVIQSCIPTILKPGLMPTIDIDFALIAIRIATYGETLDMEVTCPECKAKSSFALNLQAYLEKFQNRTFPDSNVIEGLKFNYEPMTYDQMTAYNLRNYTFQRQVVGLPEDWTKEQKDAHISEVMKELTALQLEIMLEYISSIESTNEKETDPKSINDFIAQSDSLFYREIKKHVEEIKKTFNNPLETVNCAECDHAFTTNVNMDYSSFFVTRS